jgi:hypothetical protein
MTWQRRIAELLLAGGTLTAATGCFQCNGAPDPCCNPSNPCCSNSSSAACIDWKDCTADGGLPSSEGNAPVCILPDAGPADGGS